MNILRKLLHPKIILSGLLAAVLLTLGFGMMQKPAQAAVDCDDNAVIKCGYTDLNDFGKKFAANPNGDLQQLYGYFGFTNINTFNANAKHVTVYKSTGQVKLDDGTIVATNAASLGRKPITGNDHTLTIKVNGKDKSYYYGPVQGNFGSSSLDGFAQFNPDDHSMIFATLKACGNLVWSNNNPGYKCKMLTKTQPNKNDPTTYNFLATPFVKGGATVSRIVYDFGDGTSKTVTNPSDFAKQVSHTYAPGDWTARATVFFSVNGKEQSDTRADCTTPVNVPKPKPVFNCTELISKRVGESRTQFTFTVHSHVANGAVLKTATFKYDDGQTKTVTATNGSASDMHEYTKTGDHTTKVDLTFNDGTDNNNQKCVAHTTTLPPTCKDTPTKPECMPCQFNGDINSTSPECKPPKTCADTPEAAECKPPETCQTNPGMEVCKKLPETGPEEFVGTFLGLSSITGAGAYYHASRRNLLSRLLK